MNGDSVEHLDMDDGNQRLGWLACAVFLDLNGIDPTTASNDGVFDLVIDLAANSIDVPELATRLGAIVDLR